MRLETKLLCSIVIGLVLLWYTLLGNGYFWTQISTSDTITEPQKQREEITSRQEELKSSANGAMADMGAESLSEAQNNFEETKTVPVIGYFVERKDKIATSSSSGMSSEDASWISSGDASSPLTAQTASRMSKFELKERMRLQKIQNSILEDKLMGRVVAGPINPDPHSIILSNSAGGGSGSGSGSSSSMSRSRGKEGSKYAYVTLLHGVDESLRYRGFLYNALIMARALREAGSTADFLVLVGFTRSELASPYGETPAMITADLALLRDRGIRVVLLPRLLPASAFRPTDKVSFAEMALLKILPWSGQLGKQYEKIQYLDGDVLPRRNMDCFFGLHSNTFNTGSASPLNSGWLLAIPDKELYDHMRTLALKRLQTRWDESMGWGTPLPHASALTDKAGVARATFRGGVRPVRAWSFNGASLDQGLARHCFLLSLFLARLLLTHISV
jgi:hypothetical protein